MTTLSTNTMKAIMKIKPSAGAVYSEAGIPPIGPADLLIKVKAASICGTDVHIFKWDTWAQNRVKPPLIFGHEFTGEIIATGNQVTGFVPGDYISAESHIPCGRCLQCHTDRQHICANLKILGIDTNGGFAEYAVVPQICAWKNPPTMPLEIASIQEPLGNAVYATLVEEIAGRNVAVFGCGPSGLFSIGVARAGGAAKVIAIIKHEFRRAIAEAMGATVVLNSTRDPIVEQVLQETKGAGVDVVLEMTGNQDAISQSLAIVTKGGRISAFGIPRSAISVDWAREVVFKGVRLIGINGRKMYDSWHQMSNLLESGLLDPTPVITHKLQFSEFEEGMALMQSKDRRCGKVVLLL